jgi:uncharacterized RDD family membrane protein YckC
MNGATPGATHPAGFWIRLLAFLIDAVVIVIAQFLLQVIAAARFGADGALGAVGFFTFLFAVAYPTVLHTIAGQTLGKLATRVRVVALDGAALPLGAAFLRAVGFWAALLLTLGIGHVVGGLRKDKRTFHDLLAGSRAERLPRATPVRRASLTLSVPPVAASPGLVPPNPFQPPAAESEPRSTG